MKVLVTDDNADCRELVRHALSVHGIEVIEAAGGSECLERAQDACPDAILLDVMMPLMDGPGTLAALRANPVTAAIPVIFLTASAMPSEIRRLEGLDVAGVITKPFRPDALAARLGEALRWSSADVLLHRPPAECGDTSALRARFLRRLPPTQDAPAMASKIVDRTSGPERPLAGLKVVVADDQVDSLAMIGFLLTREGAAVTGVASGAEAYSAIKRDPPHVFLSDIEMPDESGYALIQRVRALAPEQGGKVPAGAMTGHGSRDDRDRALASGFQRHLLKPFQPSDLITLVADLAGRSVEPPSRAARDSRAVDA